MNNIKIVIFDCDGVLFDTLDVNRAYYNRILNYFGFPDINDEQFDFAQCHTADQSLEYILGDKMPSQQDIDEFKKDIDYTEFLEFMIIEPHLIDLLKYLRPKYKTAIATNRSDTMPLVMDKFELNDHFDMVVTSFDVKKPKPDPESIFKILNTFKLSTKEAIFIGDSEVDEMTAKNSDVLFIAYNNPKLTAQYHIKSLREIKSIV